MLKAMYCDLIAKPNNQVSISKALVNHIKVNTQHKIFATTKRTKEYLQLQIWNDIENEL